MCFVSNMRTKARDLGDQSYTAKQRDLPDAEENIQYLCIYIFLFQRINLYYGRDSSESIIYSTLSDRKKHI